MALAIMVPVLPVAHLEHQLLSVFATFISGEAQLPAFIISLKINDVPMRNFDSSVKMIVSRRYWVSNDTSEKSINFNGEMKMISVDLRVFLSLTRVVIR
ncbi:major histocompatibility complex class I-related gene protein-like isoform X2 [Arapaima gigas]